MKTQNHTPTQAKAEAIAAQIREKYPQFETTVEHSPEDNYGIAISSINVRFTEGYRAGYFVGTVDFFTSVRYTGRKTTSATWASYSGGKRRKVTRREFFWHLLDAARYGC